MEYYVFANEASAQACLNYINSTPWFPIVGTKNNKPAPESQTTTSWAESPAEMLSGEWAVPRIPTSRLDHLGVTQDSRNAFLSAFGNDIRDLGTSDF